MVKDWIDVNRPELQKAESLEAQGNLCCWCCESEPINIRGNIPHVGYYIQQGNSIPVTVSVENQTNRRIEGETLTLLKKVSYITTGQTRSDRFNLGRIQSLSIPAQSTRERRYRLPIVPSCTPSIMNCSMIELTYYVKIRAVGQTIEIPVTLGVPRPDTVSGSLPPQYEECCPPLEVITTQPVS